MCMDRKCLIILTPGFPANEEDSTCVPFPQSFVQNLKLLNPAMHIIVLTFQYPFNKVVYEWKGVEVHAFNGRNKGKFSRIWIWKKVWFRMRKIFQSENVIGILSFWLGETALIAKYAAKKYRVRSFVWLLGQDARSNNRYVSMIKPKPESLIALSDFLADEFFRNHHIRPMHTIPPGIDTVAFPAQLATRHIDILGVGSLIPLKQYDQFIKIVAGMVKTHPDIRTLICGEGPERRYLQQLIDDLLLNDRIELAGELKHEKILEIMQDARILLHPSSYEGFSTVCAEALYAGTQVVSYCKPMHVDFEQHHIVKTTEEMQSKVLELLNATGQNEHRVLTYPIGDVCNRIMSLYN
jgi:glycosyltransferase involved in cell wall biosynthesis